MRSKRAKVLHPLAGRPILSYLLDLVDHVNPSRALVVVGHQADEVVPLLKGYKVEHVRQEQQRGTGDAVRVALTRLADFSGTILVLNGDTPLLSSDTIERMVAAHRKSQGAITLLSAEIADPAGYGRVIRKGGKVIGIVEEKEADKRQQAIREINVGVYLFDPLFLQKSLPQLSDANRKKEYYLTDLVAMAVSSGRKVEAIRAEDPQETLGINSRIDLARMEKIVARRILERLMREGVTIIDPERTRVEASVRVGTDSTLYPGTTLEGDTVIGEGCTIRGARISDSSIADRVTILDHCVIEGTQIDQGATVGPFSRLRPGTVVGRMARIGNFVEVKKSVIGEGSKANHLSYLGDAVVGKGVNIGAGTITCNYDGVKKHQTIIGDEVFVGSDTQFVAPVKIGSRSIIAAGSVITEDVPPDALAVARSRQTNKENWTKEKRKRGR